MTSPSTTLRADGRRADEMRPVTITRRFLDAGEGSVLVEFGSTKVLCVASFTEGVPRWRKGSGQGWVTAEYSMLPRATSTRSDRESVRGKIGGRTHEISRLIGRSLRAIIDVAALGENTLVLDCDVLQADGGTRTAAITGAYVALADAVAWGVGRGLIDARRTVLRDAVAAVSVGIVDGAIWRFCTLRVALPDGSAATTILAASSGFLTASFQPLSVALRNLPILATNAGSFSLPSSTYRPSSSEATPSFS